MPLLSAILLVLTATIELYGQEAPWWSHEPLRTITPPNIRSASIHHPVDAFLLRRLHTAGIAPSRPADRRTLIRRLTFDLHGLPPTPAETKAFEHDPREDAYQRLVDRLL